MFRLDSSFSTDNFNSYKLKSEPTALIYKREFRVFKLEQSNECPFALLEYNSRTNGLFSYDDLHFLYFSPEMELLIYNQTSQESSVIYKFPNSWNIIKDGFVPTIVVLQGYAIIATGCESKYYIFKIREDKWTLEFEIGTEIFESQHCPTILEARLNSNSISMLALYSKKLNSEFFCQLTTIDLQSGELFMIGSPCVGKRIPYMSLLNEDYFSLVSECTFKMESVDEAETNEVKSSPSKPLYLWTQSDQEIVIYVDLPQTLHKSNVNVFFRPDHINAGERQTMKSIISGKLFSQIDPSESIWTIENGALLTFYLAKKGSMRWSQVFHQDDGVLETLESATLSDYKQRLEKYTAQEQENNIKEMVALTENAEQVDFEMGTATVSCFSISKEAKVSLEKRISSGFKWLCNVFGTKNACLITDVDGACFKIERNNSIHLGSFPALGYIRASKRDASFVCISNEFEYGIIIEAKRYIYLYLHPQGKSSSTQYIFDLREDHSESNSMVVGYILRKNLIYIAKQDGLVAFSVCE